MSALDIAPRNQATSAARPLNIDVRKMPSWPAFSIVILEVLAGIAPPGLLTAMNSYLLLIALLVWSSSRERSDAVLVQIVAPFLAIILIGLAMGAGADFYLYLKDVWYVANPAIILSAGYVLYRCKPDLGRGLRAFIIGGTLLGAISISRLIAHPALLMLPSMTIRQYIGTGYYGPALTLIILCAHFGRWKEKLKLSLPVAITCLVICILAVGLSFSRTIVMVVVIGTLASIGSFARREWLRFGLVAVIGCAALGLLRWTIDVPSAGAQVGFWGKTARSLDELRVEEYADLKSINVNWRGYETARALKHFESGSIANWLFGYGFGAQVDLGLPMQLGGTPENNGFTRSIPIFHNGYIYLLIKGGILSIVLFGYAATSLYMIGRRLAGSADIGWYSAPARVMQAVTLSIAITTWLISGVFNKADMFAFLLAAGFLAAGLTRIQSPANDRRS
jgi:hypothetical protein